MLLSIKLGAICTRNMYTHDPGRVVDELIAAAGRRVDILTAEVGLFVGFYDGPDTHALCAALLERIPDAGEHVSFGIQRRGESVHGTTGFRRNDE